MTSDWLHLHLGRTYDQDRADIGRLMRARLADLVPGHSLYLHHAIDEPAHHLAVLTWTDGPSRDRVRTLLDLPAPADTTGDHQVRAPGLHLAIRLQRVLSDAVLLAWPGARDQDWIDPYALIIDTVDIADLDPRALHLWSQVCPEGPWRSLSSLESAYTAHHQRIDRLLAAAA